MAKSARALPLRILDHLEEWIIAFLIAAATALIFVAVLHRYALDVTAKVAALSGLYDTLFKINLSWAQELCIFMFVWMAKFGAAYGVRTGVHVGVDVVVNSLNIASKKRVILFGLFCGAFFTFVVGSFGARFVTHMFETGQRSYDLEAPMWIVYLAIPLGSYLMCFRFLQVAFAFWRTGELPHTDESHVEGVEPIPEDVIKVDPQAAGVAHAGAG